MVYMLVTLIVLTTGSFFVWYIWIADAITMLAYPTGFMNQVAADWASPPLTDIIATTDTACPAE